MATAEQYAKWCMMLIEGEDHMIDDIFYALYEDGYIDEDQEWNVEEEEDDE
jgi:hypothetical protein